MGESVADSMEKKKRVLLLSTKFRGLYNDIMAEIKRQDYDVVFVEDIVYSKGRFDDPLRVRRDWARIYSDSKKEEFNQNYWRQIFDDKDFNPYFDYLLVIDGFTVCDYIISVLKSHNTNIKKVLYMYDSVQNVYRFDKNFKYFDSIYSFDIQDAKKFNINLLPIYWTPVENRANRLDVFGFAGYGPNNNRYNVYKAIYEMAVNYDLKSYIKLIPNSNNNNRIIKTIQRLLHRDYSLSASTELVAKEALKPEEFRDYMSSSRVIVDALMNDQTGMTTRFSWAIGAGKKIITNNPHIKEYAFYDPEQVWIYRDGETIPKSFFIEDVEMKEDIKIEVEKFRVDNWVKQLLS